MLKDANKSKDIHAEIKSKLIVGERLITFSPEYIVFQYATYKCTDKNIQNYDFASVLYGCEIWSCLSR